MFGTALAISRGQDDVTSQSLPNNVLPSVRKVGGRAMILLRKLIYRRDGYSVDPQEASFPGCDASFFLPVFILPSAFPFRPRGRSVRPDGRIFFCSCLFPSCFCSSICA